MDNETQSQRSPEPGGVLALDVAAADRDLGTLAKHVAFVSINANPHRPAVADVKAWTDAHGLGSADN